jgi:opacity protein-like surface antigen
MKRLVVATLFVLGMACAARAQDEASQSPQASGNLAADFANTTAASSVFPQDARAASYQISALDADWAGGPPIRFAVPKAALPLAQPNCLWAAAEPELPAPSPRFIFGGRDDFRYQLAIGVSMIRFRSSSYYATAVGTSTSLTYFTNQSFGIEGSVITAFAPTIYVNEHVKYFSYGGGPKLAWRQPRWEPWVHAILGGAHIVPQTGVGGHNAFAFQAGGGVDYRINPRISARVEVDWVRTHFFGQWQNNGQAALDGVLHF